MLGHFCTGVTVITTVDPDGRPAGFACQSFAALSLDPPLVLFCPSRTSATWPRIAQAGHFCANVLTAGQRDLARVFGTAGTDKFAGVAWSPSASGAPVLAGVLTWVGCEVEAVHEAGDHYVVLGRVTELGPVGPTRRCCSTGAATASPPQPQPTARRRSSTPCWPGPGTPTGSSFALMAFTVPEYLAGTARCDRGVRDWITVLPAIVAALADRWSLRVGEPFQPGGQCSWTAPATGPAGAGLVLKVGFRFPGGDERDEAAGLAAVAGERGRPAARRPRE